MAARPGLLDQGEQVVAAGRARTVAGTETALRLPPTTIWAVSDRRLFVFDAAARNRRMMPPPLLEVPIDPPLTARVEPYEQRDLLLVVGTPGGLDMVLMNADDAQAIVEALVTDSAAALDEESGAVPADDPDGRWVSGLPRWSEYGDSTGGDQRIDDLRHALMRRDVDGAADAFRAFSTAAAREWGVRHLVGADLVDGLDDWVERDPESPSAYLARGANAVWTAFAGRPAIGDPAFYDQLRHAENDLFWAIELDFDDPVAFTPLIRSGSGLGIAVEELCRRFDESVRRNADMFGLHAETLVALSPLDGGSVTEAVAFARSCSSGAAAGSPLHALVPLAHLICRRGARGRRRSSQLSSEAIREVDLARALSVDHADWAGGPGSAEVWQIFAAAASASGAPELARASARRGGPVRTFYPWSALADGEERYRSVLAGTP